jgi:serine/threonine protein kinase
VTEVQVMHKLDSPHTLRFHDWYETRNNLWLILEYCTGSDLCSLLQQDGHLPEKSVRAFGLDMLAGLKYMHGLGLLHCDLRPSNFLVDEYGILKLCDFKFARRVPKTPLGPLDGSDCKNPLTQRGTCEYMAPELWRQDGLHSYSSDFWALGCVLYELRRGQEPFGVGDTDHARKQLLQNIETIEPVMVPLAPFKAIKPTQSDSRTPGGTSDSNTPGRVPDCLPSMSAELGDLLRWLLEKQPQSRPDWVTVSSHPFWGRRSNPVPQSLPDQDAFDSMVRQYERSAERQLQEDIIRECGLTPRQAQDVVDGVPPATPQGLDQRVPGSATKTPQHKGLHPHVSDSTPIRPDERKPVSHVRTALGPIIGEEKAEAKDYDTYESPSGKGRSDSKDIPPSQLSTPVITHNGHQHQLIEVGQTHAVDSVHRVTTPGAHHAQAYLSTNPNGSYFGSPDSPSHDNDSKNTAANYTGQVTPGALGDMTPATDVPNGRRPAVAWPAEQSAEQLLLHASDSQVKPIVANKNIEPVEKFAVRVQLPFDTLPLQEVQSLTTEALEQHLTTVYKAIQRVSAEAASVTQRNGAAAGTAMCTDRINMLNYLASIGSVAEVANVVLNTNFLALLLKLLKAESPKDPVARTGSRGSSRGTERDRETQRGVVVTPAMTNLRTMSATVLATMLRYATYVSPPTAKNKDEHLLPVLTGILKSEYPPAGNSNGHNHGTNKEVTRLDAKLKRRVLAALGETLFYMSSQGAVEEQTSTDGPWPLPPGTMTSLVRCLKDESDEVIRHYAAKTIENIMAQGSNGFKRRLVSIDIATRLLELSQNGLNDALQASCGMALAHIFTFVVASEPTDEPPSPAQGASVRGVRNLNRSPSSANSDSSGMTPGAGARFMVKVLDRGGLPAILETLNDGQARLQQAYLNIVNLLFAQPAAVSAAVKATNGDDNAAISPESPKISNRRTSSANTPGAADLKPIRQFFLRGATLVQTVLKLIEQGASSAVRAKAMLLAQLLCLHQPSLLVHFSERRLPSILMRLVEPLVVAASGGSAVRSSRQGGLTSANTDDNGIPKGSAAYPMNAAVSFVSSLRTACINATNDIAKQCTRIVLASRPNTPGSNSSKFGRPGSANSASKRRPGSPATTSPHVFGRNSPSSLSVNSPATAKVDLNALYASADTLRAAVTAAALPSLRRLILADGPKLVLASASALHQLSAARIALSGSSQSEQWTIDAYAALAVADQAMLVCLEGIAAVEPSDLSLGIGHHASTADALEAFALEGGGAEGVDTGGSYAESLVSLLPAMAQLCTHPEGDVRVVLASALRRLLPGTLRALQFSIHDRDALRNASQQSIRAVCAKAVNPLVRDQAPIPQYVVRMLLEAMQVNTDCGRLVVQLCTTEECLPSLIAHYARSTQTEEWEQEYDPQLTALLRALFEQSSDATLLLETGFTSAIVAVLHCRVHHEQVSVGRGEGLSRSRRTDYLAAVAPMLDLLYITLHFVIRKLTKGEDSSNTIRTLVEAARSACYTLVSIMTVALLDLAPSNTTSGTATKMQIQGIQSTGDTASRALGILFDLYPDTVSAFMCKDVRSTSNLHVPLYVNGRQAAPRDCFAELLRNAEVPSRLRSRLIKILGGANNFAEKLGTTQEIRALLTTAPLHDALELCAQDGAASGGDGKTMTDLARQVLASV